MITKLDGVAPLITHTPPLAPLLGEHILQFDETRKLYFPIQPNHKPLCHVLANKVWIVLPAKSCDKSLALSFSIHPGK